MIVTSLAVRFLLEVAGVAALAYAGAHSSGGPWRWVAAVALPAVMIVVWAHVAAPQARIGLSQAARQLLGSVLLLVAAAALAVAGAPVAAVAYAVAIVADTALLRRLGATDVRAAMSHPARRAVAS